MHVINVLLDLKLYLKLLFLSFSIVSSRVLNPNLSYQLLLPHIQLPIYQACDFDFLESERKETN